MKNANFTHLHVHTEFSMLDGLGSPDAYAKKASEMGFTALACTDHGNFNGLIEFQQACDRYEISPILGCEAYIVPDATEKKNRNNGHVIILVKNQKGFRNLCNLLTYANLQGLYYKPRIDYQSLLDHCEGLVVSTACFNSFIMKEGGEDFFRKLKEKMNEDLYLEIMPHKIDNQVKANKKVLLLSQQTGTKIIATNDCHYIKYNHWEAQEVLLAIQTKAKWKDPKRWKFSIKGLHLCSARELTSSLKSLSFYKKEYLTNTQEITEKCRYFRIQKQKVFLPRVKNIPLKFEKNKFLWSLCVRGFRRKFKSNIKSKPVYYDRLKEECELINKKNFGRYFLIVWELVNWCKKNGVIVGCGRGSAAGSLISYLLNITTVDPIKHDLLFSRFINKDRIDYPDIDVDFEDNKRHIVKQHLEELYGENHIAHVSSFNRMKAKGVVRDVGRVFDIPLVEVDVFAKVIEDNDTHTGIQEAIDDTEEGANFYKQYPKIVKIAQILEGCIRNRSAHAAALIISRDSLVDSDRCNLIKREINNEETILINWEKNNAEYVGLMKLDALGLKILSIFSETKNLILENYDINIDIDKIDIEDKKTIKEINKGHTIGLFQLSAYALTNLIKPMGIHCFKDLSDALALVRPGPSMCITADSLIRTWSGKKVRIDNIDIGRPIVSSSFVEGRGQRFVRNIIKDVIYSGKKIVFEIKTSDNKIIKATALHQFFVKKQRPAKHYWAKHKQYQKNGKWTTLRKIKVGDLIVTRCPNFTNAKRTSHNKKLIKHGKKTRYIKRIPYSYPHNSIKFSVVTSIKKLGYRLTYDIVTENQNFPNYIANDFMVHNSGMTDEYVKRKHGQKWTPSHEIYEKITKDTFGIIVYQEQVMEVINKIAGLPYTTADKIRKIIGKKRSVEEFAPYKKKFIRGCLENKTFTKKEAEDFWIMLQQHAHYSFGKAHSVSYSILGMQSAWLKRYYPTEFICASLTYGSKEKKKLLIEEAYRLGLCLVLPKVGISDATKWIVKGKKLYIPFAEIKSVGPSKALQAATITTTNNNFKNLFFIKNKTQRTYHKGALRKLLETIGAYNMDSTTQITEEVQSYFDFRILTDPYSRYKNLYEFFNNKIRLDRVDKVVNGDLKEIKTLADKKQIVIKTKFKGHPNLLSCIECERKDWRRAPVSPSRGKYNIVICGECPGRDEDAKGISFTGMAGKDLWKAINKRNYRREDFHVTNVVKCIGLPGTSPTAKQIKVCGRFLKKELNEIKPKVILAFGNTSLNFFTGQKSGIMNFNKKTIWNEEFSSWVCFCIHPAAILHNPENKKLFLSGIANFFKLLDTLIP